MFGLTTQQIVGLGIVAVAVLGFLFVQYRQELGGVAGWFGGLFRRSESKPDADAVFNAAINACDVLMLHPDAEVKRLAALAARRVTEVTYPVPPAYQVELSATAARPPV